MAGHGRSLRRLDGSAEALRQNLGRPGGSAPSDGDGEMRALVPIESLPAVAALIRVRRRRSPSPAQLRNLVTPLDTSDFPAPGREIGVTRRLRVGFGCH